MDSEAKKARETAANPRNIVTISKKKTLCVDCGKPIEPGERRHTVIRHADKYDPYDYPTRGYVHADPEICKSTRPIAS
jgi:hypothetical protein